VIVDIVPAPVVRGREIGTIAEEVICPTSMGDTSKFFSCESPGSVALSMLRPLKPSSRLEKVLVRITRRPWLLGNPWLRLRNVPLAGKLLATANNPSR
jgi:hypothetical protein